ncbi:hypothetical protein [Olsenella profusa]|uniref:Uncharacterized protein n=1 Tax=Olsenella profusa F0195 TaxID=1125712 RepID=U2TP23_9ACTN|nr:hypothetical protein [Olsenella profusa]ERL07878.1 hypothetical protein HMPREF1316_1772 [Olsenella profusa F0195]
MSRKHNKRGNKNKGKKEKRNARASKVATDGALPDIQDDEDTLEDEESTTSSEKPKRGRTSKRHKESTDDHEDNAPKRSKRSKKSGKSEGDSQDEGSKDKGRKNAPRSKGKGSSQTSHRGSAGTRSSRSPRTIGRRQGLTTTSWVWIAIACALVGMLFGRFVLTRITGGVIDGSLSGKTTVTADQLNTVMGTYTYKGQTYNITAQDVLDTTSSQNQANADGTYNLPSADGVLAVARTQILTKAADDQGITVSDDELSQFAQQHAGTSDFDQIASNFGISADKVKQEVTDTAKIDKLRDSVVTTTVPDAPTAPTEPSDGNKDATSKEYADYIINLAGSEWDANAGTWAATDGSYASALANYTVTPDSASYNAALAAYVVASQKYQAAAQQASQGWTNYVNSQLAQANLQLGTLVI